MGKGSSGSRKDSTNGPRDQEQYRNEQRNNQRGKYYYPKYIQEKLAITVLVITLALFALVMILYRIIKDNNEQYNKIVLSQRQQEYDSRIIVPPGRHCGQERHLSGYQREGLQSDH